MTTGVLNTGVVRREVSGDRPEDRWSSHSNAESNVGTVVGEIRGRHKAALSLATSSGGAAVVRATIRISFSLTSMRSTRWRT